MRRLVESNHILQNRTSRLSIDDQNHLVSTSPNLRTLYSRVFGNKNNTFIAEDAVFGPIADVAPIDNRDQYSRPAYPVNTQSSPTQNDTEMKTVSRAK